MTMRGAVLYAPGDVRVEERQDPRILAPTDAVIRLSATGVCGSDLWPYRGIEAVDGPSPMGREYCGIVQEVGRQVTNITPGQFVVGSFFASDNTCPICQAGYQSSCINRVGVGEGGAQAESLRIPLADGTLVATPERPPEDLIPACWPPRTCSAPAGSAPWPPRPARARPSRWSVTVLSVCSPCWRPSSSARSRSSR
jgi:threonine dehydrogenase-like Zn-dependent dehydrogenase